jgi:radical SAM superfamily enzyme YgiQ (UPF0313 family)
MHIYDRKIDYLSAKPVDIVNVIRGCSYDCAYCETKKVWGNKCRAFSPNRIVDEVDYLVNNYGSKGIYFVGDNFTINQQHTLEVCDLIKQRKLDVEWVCDTRVDLLSRDLLQEMKSAGCKSIFFGIQSGAPHILRKLNIKFTREQVIQTFKLLREEGINIASSFMLGIPGETVEDMETTFKFAKDLDPDWCHFYVFIACPTSRLYEEVLQKGLYDLMEDFLAYPKTKDFDYELVLEMQKRFQTGFNLSRKRILRKIRREGFLSVMKKGLAYGFSSLNS